MTFSRQTGRRQRWVEFAMGWFLYFIFGVHVVALAPFVTPIMADLSINNGQMGVILGAWTPAAAVASLPSGALINRFGTRHSLALAAAAMALSAALRAVADGFWMMLVAMAVFGAASSVIIVGMPTLIAQLFEGRQRQRAAGIYMTAAPLGFIAVYAAGTTILIQALGSWRCVVGAFGVLASVGGLGWWLLAGDESNGDGVRSFDRRLVARVWSAPAVRLVVFLGTVLFITHHALINWLPEILSWKGIAAADAAVWSAIPIVAGIAGVVVLPMMSRVPIGTRIGACSFMMATGLLCILVLPGTVSVVGLIVFGLPMFAVLSLYLLMLMDENLVPLENVVGAASGLFFAFAEGGAFLGPLALGVLREISGGFATGLGLLALVNGVAAARLAVMIRTEYSKRRARQPPGRAA